MYGNGPRMSGANQTPLGAFGVPGIRKPAPSAPSASESLLNPSYLQSFKSGGLPTSDFPWPGAPPPPPLSSSSDIGKRPAAFDGPDHNGGERKRKKRSRWADEDSKANVPMPTVLPPGLTKEQEEAFLLQLQIEEITRRLRTGDLGIPANPEERSPSPEPIYNHEGKRMNTREYRTRKKLEEERHKYIVRMSELNKDYKPPMDYKPPIIKISDKVMIPQDENPGINFVGLLIGPRGNTLKAMEKETGAKIIIRGKGSVKEGKVGRKDGQPLPGEDEPLHAYVTSSSAESVKKAVEKIKEVIRQGIEVPEGQNDLRRMQLRELALLNGTLRELDIPRCNNCGATSHKSWECPDKPNVTANVICSACGGGGHIARDCRQRRIGPPGEPDQSKIDEEYSALMAELGEAPPKAPGTGGPGGSRFGAPQQVGGYGYGRGGYTQRPRPPGPGGYGQMGHQPAPPGAGVSQWGVPPPGVPPPGVPPPGMGYGAPQGGQWGAPQMQGYGQMSQYAGFMQPPPPPPPVSGANGQSGGHNAADSQAAMNQWGMQGMQGMQAMQGWGMPPPVPPPSWGQPQTGQGTGQMGYMGVPPPPPVSKMSSASRIDLNALAQAGLPNLLAAPPPPPPPPQ